MFGTYRHLINIHPFLFSLLHPKIKPPLRPLLPIFDHNILFSFFSFQTLNSVSAVLLLPFTPQPTAIWLFPAHSTGTPHTNETKIPKCPEFHRFNFFFLHPKSDSCCRTHEQIFSLIDFIYFHDFNFYPYSMNSKVFLELFLLNSISYVSKGFLVLFIKHSMRPQ